MTFVFWGKWIFFFPFNFNQVGSTALHLSAHSQHEGKEKMRVLVEYGTNVDAQDTVSFNLNKKEETDLSVYISDQ